MAKREQVHDDLQKYVDKVLTFPASPVLKIVTVDGGKSLHSGTLRFSKPDETIASGMMKYKDLFLQTIVMSKKVVKPFLSNLILDGHLLHEDLDFIIDCSIGTIREQKSNSSLGYLKSDWPSKYCEISFQSPASLSHDPVVANGLPMFPDGQKAVVNFLEINHLIPPSNFYIQIPDYSAKISQMKISDRKIELKIQTHLEKPEKLVCRMYAERTLQGPYENKIIGAMHSPELQLSENLFSYEFPDQFDSVYSAIINCDDYSVLDSREFRLSWDNQDDITIERPEYDLRGIIRRGETDTTEFKLELSDEFQETIVAFANSSGGILLLGIADDGRINGFRAKSDDQIENIINGNLDPIPKFSVRETLLDDKPITIVEVFEGDDKPYSHRELGVYVRRGGSDLRGTRSDWERLFRERIDKDPYRNASLNYR